MQEDFGLKREIKSYNTGYKLILKRTPDNQVLSGAFLTAIYRGLNLISIAEKIETCKIILLRHIW